MKCRYQKCWNKSNVDGKRKLDFYLSENRKWGKSQPVTEWQKEQMSGGKNKNILIAFHMMRKIRRIDLIFTEEIAQDA